MRKRLLLCLFCGEWGHEWLDSDAMSLTRCCDSVACHMDEMTRTGEKCAIASHALAQASFNAWAANWEPA